MARSIDKKTQRPYSEPIERLRQQAEQRDKAETERNKSAQRAKQQDAARFVSQVAPHSQAWAKSKFGAGEYGRQPIPLDPSDIDDGSWSSEALDRVTDHLTLKASSFKSVARVVTKEGVPLPLALIASVFKPTEDDTEKLQALVQRDAEMARQAQTQEVEGHLRELFGLRIEPGRATRGQVAMAASLVVAGLGHEVRALPDGDIDDASLARGAAAILDRGKAAVDLFRTMQRGINKQVSALRTLVFKR